MFSSSRNFNILSVSISTGLQVLQGVLVGFLWLMMKNRIQNYTTTQMTKSFLLKFSAYKVNISETDLPKVVLEIIFKN